MAIPDYQALMRPLLEKAQGGEWRMVDLARLIADDLMLIAEERIRRLPSDRQQVFNNRLHWAKLHLSRARLVEPISHGVFRTSSSGTAFLRKHNGAISVAMLKQLPDYQQAEAETGSPQFISVPSIAPTDQATPQERIANAQSEIAMALSIALLERVREAGPAFFEALIVRLLVAMGYGGTHENAARAIGGSGDGGIDGVIDEDRLGLDRVYLQAKCYQASSVIGSPDLQSFVGALTGKKASKGVFVTTSSFSQPARDFVDGLPMRVSLIDGRTLAALMIEHSVGVRTEEKIILQAIDEEFFDPS